MTTSTNKAGKAKATQLAEEQAEPSAERQAENILAPERPAATIVMTYLNMHDVPVGLAVMDQLQVQHAKVAAGDMSDAESMLMSQAVALQAIFANLATRAKDQSELSQIQTLTVLAIKAQSACRATIQALGDLKFPRQAMFVKQANIANGPQQVNNGVTVGHAHEAKPDSANKLSGTDHELLQDTRSASSTVAGNQSLATMGKVNRAKVRRG
jgi:hypothetical protein